MAARAKVPGQIERLLARKAMWDAAREQAEREFSMSASEHGGGCGERVGGTARTSAREVGYVEDGDNLGR